MTFQPARLMMNWTINSDDSSSHCLSSAVKLLMAYDAEGPYGVLNSSCGAAIVMLWAWKLTGDEDYRKCAKDTMLGAIYGDKTPAANS